MAIHSYGYVPDDSTQDLVDKEFQLLTDNLPLIFQHKQDIFNCAEYFFCNLTFAYCSWPYASGCGPLYLGYLLLGWDNGNFTGKCPDCGNTVLITSFAGSFSGDNRWTGYCPNCNKKQRSCWDTFISHMNFAGALSSQFPFAFNEWEEYLGQEFTWGGSGLKPAMKKRMITKTVANPVGLEKLIDDLKADNICKGNPVNVSLLKQDLELKPFSRS